MVEHNGLVEYSTATAMAEVYQREVENIRRLMYEFNESMCRLRSMFMKEGGHSYDFTISLHYHSSNHSLDDEGFRDIERELHRSAWRALVDKLDIRKLMSAEAQNKLNDQLDGRNRYGDKVEPLPEIAPENILGVLNGMIESAGEFMEDKIREAYKFWTPHRKRYATDNCNRLAEKVIKGWMVRRTYNATWEPNYDRHGYLTALDSIMHTLDGAGIPAEYVGDLVTAIRNAPANGKGESRYFKFACFHNGNIHLRFKRLDLLEIVNRVGAGMSLPQAREERRGTTAV